MIEIKQIIAYEINWNIFKTKEAVEIYKKEIEEKEKELSSQWKIIKAYYQYSSYYEYDIRDDTIGECISELKRDFRECNSSSQTLIVEKDKIAYIACWGELIEELEERYWEYEIKDLLDFEE